MTIPADHRVPSWWDAVLFGAKAAVLRGRRALREIRRRPPRHPRADGLGDAAIVAEIRSPLWSGPGGEHDLTAGKIHNLRLAVRALDGVEVPAGAVFSFWRQIGRASRRRGFVAGRELREGCLVASTGGGLCQLSNGLYEAALAAGFEIVERHAHSRLVPGSRAAAGRDATVFWNYVDLRFRSPAAFRIEARLTGAELEIRFRGAAVPAAGIVVPFPAPREAANDCVGCAHEGCSRHLPKGPEITRRPTAWLVDACWPEFATLMRAQAGPEDGLFLPMRWPARARYAWPELAGGESRATLVALARARALRRLPAVGGALPRAMLDYDRRLAEAHAGRLSYRHTHLVVGQGLLPHLWRLGCLQGRSFDVLMERWPLAALQARLDRALARHSESPTLGDFRAPEEIVAAEAEALAVASRLYTPHSGIVARFADRAVHLDWALPDVATAPRPAIGGRTILFPASALGRKGAYALRDAVEGLDIDLAVTGRAREQAGTFWRSVAARALPAGPWPDPVAAVVLPAIVEHQPRALLRALALGIPVIATAACGLDEGPGVTLVPEDDAAALREALLQALGDAAPQRIQTSARNSA